MDANERENGVEILTTTIAERDRLIEALKGLGKVAVAFSGGVDSTVVAKAAQLALGDNAIAVTAVSQSLAEGELENAEELARASAFNTKLSKRKNLKPKLSSQRDRPLLFLQERVVRSIVEHARDASGRSDRLGCERGRRGRPSAGLGGGGGTRRAASALGTRHGEKPRRAIAKSWDLPTWDKPASPCLSSRIAYGKEVTPERARMIDQAEQWLRRRGLRVVRVRYHKGDLARVEVPADDLATLASLEVRSELSKAFHALGFKFVTLDLDGFRSGSLNTLIPLDRLVRSSPRG